MPNISFKRRLCLAVAASTAVQVIFGCAGVDQSIGRELEQKPRTGEVQQSHLGPMIRSATEEEANAARERLRQIQLVDRQYPGPQYDLADEPEQVLIVSTRGVFHMRSGRRWELAGVQCEPEYYRVLAERLNARSVYLSAKAVTRQVRAARAAYLWEVQQLVGQEKAGVEKPVSVTSINDNAALSRLCRPRRYTNDLFGDRWRALSAISEGQMNIAPAD